MEKNFARPQQGGHRRGKGVPVQQIEGLLQVVALLLHPGGQQVAIPGLKGMIQFLGRPALDRLLHHRPLEVLEILAAHMPGKAGDRGLRDMQRRRQLPDGHAEEFIPVRGDGGKERFIDASCYTRASNSS